MHITVSSVRHKKLHTVKITIVNIHTRLTGHVMDRHQGMDHRVNTSVLERHPRQMSSNSSRPINHKIQSLINSRYKSTINIYQMDTDAENTRLNYLLKKVIRRHYSVRYSVSCLLVQINVCARSVALSVCPLVTTMYWAKTTKSIQLSFQMLGQISPWKTVLDGVYIPDNFSGVMGRCNVSYREDVALL